MSAASKAILLHTTDTERLGCLTLRTQRKDTIDSLTGHVLPRFCGSLATLTSELHFPRTLEFFEESSELKAHTTLSDPRDIVRQVILGFLENLFLENLEI